MPGPEILLDPVDFVTVGTVGPKGRREFYLQAGKGAEIVTMLIEKQQAQALSEAVDEILENLKNQFPEVPETTINLTEWDMDLRKPIQSRFRVAQMGLGYDEARDLIVLVAQELATTQDLANEPQPQVVRLWGTREQMQALSEHAQSVVTKGRANPKSNGYMTYYWT